MRIHSSVGLRRGEEKMLAGWFCCYHDFKQDIVFLVHVQSRAKSLQRRLNKTPSTHPGGFSAAGRLEPSVASRQTPGGVGG